MVVGDILAQPPLKVDPVDYERAIGRVRRTQSKRILALVSAFKQSGCWLDIGCRYGEFLDLASRQNFTPHGLEPDPDACSRATALLGEGVVRQQMAEDDVIQDARFDVISLLDVLEHLPAEQLSQFAPMLRRKLRANGLLVVKIPSTEGLFFKIAHALGPFCGDMLKGVLRRLWQSEYAYPHTVYFSRSTLTRYLESSGFVILQHEYLADIPVSTVMDRLRLNNRLNWLQAIVIAPAIAIINCIEFLRNKSDSLLVIARRV